MFVSNMSYQRSHGQTAVNTAVNICIAVAVCLFSAYAVAHDMVVRQEQKFPAREVVLWKFAEVCSQNDWLCELDIARKEGRLPL